jgi:hypothetical protein
VTGPITTMVRQPWLAWVRPCLSSIAPPGRRGPSVIPRGGDGGALVAGHVTDASCVLVEQRPLSLHDGTVRPVGTSLRVLAHQPRTVPFLRS